MTVAELTQKTMGPEVIAQKSGSCRRCERAITAGEDYVSKVDGLDGWFHTLCAREYCAVINQHLADDEDQALAEEATAEVKAARIRQICRELRCLDVPGDVVQPVLKFAGELDRRAA